MSPGSDSWIICLHKLEQTGHTWGSALETHCRFFLPCLSFARAAAAAAESLQSCPTLCDPIGGSPPGSPVPGILQARTLEWVTISFSNAWKWKVKVKLLSRVWPSEIPWTVAFQAPPSMGFSRQEYWSGVSLLISIFILHRISKWCACVLMHMCYIDTSKTKLQLPLNFWLTD